MQENEIYDLYERDGKSPSLDDKMFSVPDFILRHPFAVPTQQFLEQIINPHNWKLVYGYGNNGDMDEDKESHELPPIYRQTVTKR